MVPTHEGDTKGSMEYWDFREYQEFVFVTLYCRIFIFTRWFSIQYHQELRQPHVADLGTRSSYLSAEGLVLREEYPTMGLRRARRTTQYYNCLSSIKIFPPWPTSIMLPTIAATL